MNIEINFSSIDWKELIKMATPFILAYIVYWIWHSQKGKEVIAGESKELLKNLLEGLALLVTIIVEKQPDMETIRQNINKGYLLSEDILRQTLLLETCLHEDYWPKEKFEPLNESFKLYRKLKQISEISENPDEFLINVKTADKLYEKYCVDLETAIKTLAIYSTYQKKIKLKKFN